MRQDVNVEGNSNIGLIVVLALVFLLVAVPSVMKISGSGTGQVEINIPTDQIVMPDPPHCNGEECEWEAEGELDRKGCVNLIVVRILCNNETVAENQMVKIETEAYEQTQALAEQGIDEAWVSEIEVREGAQGQGLGRAAWEGGDAVAKNIAGGQETVSIFADIAGWGEKIMASIEQELILISEEGFWAYIIP